MNNKPLIQCQQLTVDSDEGGNPDHLLNLKACAGNIISLIGPDHDGKTNWLKTLGGIMPAESGQLFLAGKAVAEFDKNDWVHTRTQFAYVHDHTTILSAANAMQNLMLPAMYHKTGETHEVQHKAEKLLEAINAGDNLEQLPAHLKKEQRYKIAVARALMLDPRALLMKSPFSALEVSSVPPFKQFLLNRVRENNLLLILASHDIKFALEHSDQIIYISKQQMLHFDESHRIQDCDDPEVCDYLSISGG